MRHVWWMGFVGLLSVGICGAASARSVESGSFTGSALLGPGFHLGSTLGGSSGYLLIGVQGEYAFDPAVSAVADVTVGLADTVPLRFHVGGRYRLSELGGPLSPYAQLQLAVGEIYNVLGANLTFVGARIAAGTDYFLTANAGVGAMLGLDLGGTTGARPAFYGTVDVLLYATYVF